ncbi:hypothetical protein JF535_12340 [Microbulbifer salipaludis]|uniref:Type II secretion system protein L n=1 Tax=Microbulbifer salipaludis TaxID=187980 RepID=A0ABS3E8Q1_9GAMM|nr:type II secretion system protein GspL [Microbulbifer salipaludis]MBN8431642.1 hypothetical protein [Microbulbifer salipaludis]
MSQELKLLRLREPVAGSHSGDQVQVAGSLLLQCWRDNAWHAVATDAGFQAAFRNGVSESGCTPHTGDGQRPAVAGSPDSDALTFAPEDRVILLLPGSWVWNGLENVPRAARRQSSAVGYMVEEQLADDVDELHFICEPVAGDLCSVMAIATDKLAALKGQIDRLGWPVVAAVPEYRILGDTGATSAVWFEGERAHFWLSAGKGLSVARPLAGVIAESLFAEGVAEPEEAGEAQPDELAPLRVYGDPSELELATLEQLTELAPVNDAPEALFNPSLVAKTPGNLLTGDYQITLASDAGPWWKKPAIAVAACFVLQLLFYIGAGTYYQIQAGQADESARALFTEIFPGDRPSADLRRQIMGYLNQASGGGGEFAGQLQQLSQVWATAKPGELKLQSLRFDGNRGELVLQLRAANLGQLDAVVGKLGSGQFKAELLAANELEDGVSGRIRLR